MKLITEKRKKLPTSNIVLISDLNKKANTLIKYPCNTIFRCSCLFECASFF